MPRLVSPFGLAIALLTSAQIQTAQAAWSGASEVVSASLLGSPTVVFDQSNQPTVAHSQFLTRGGRFVQNVFARQHIQGQWVLAGNEVNLRRQLDGKQPRLAIDGNGMPIVAWYEQIRRNNGRFAVHASRYDGLGWQPLGAVSDLSKSGLSHDLAIDGEGRPLVSYSESTSDGLVIFVKHWDGENWVDLGQQPIGHGYGSSIAVDHRGWITIAWSEEVAFGLRHIKVKRWNGQRWRALGSGLNANPQGNAYAPDVALDPRSGKPYVAWHEEGQPGFQVRASTWHHGSRQWVPLGGAMQAPNGEDVISTLPQLVVRRPGGPYIAWRNEQSDQVHVQRWANRAQQWVNLGRQPQTEGSSRGHDLQLDTQNTLTLIYAENHGLNDSRIYLKTWQ